MFLSDLSIKRPVFAAVMMLALVTLGLFSYRRLALDLYPDVEIPVLFIKTAYPGASPESVEREVTKKVEEAVNPIAGVKHVSSTSMEGMSLVIVEFRLEVRINEASQDARAKIQAIRGDLPEAIEEPVIQKLDFSAMPVLSLAVRSDTMPPRELSTLVDKKIKPKLESLSGVGKVDLVGLSKREVAVEVDPGGMEALGMGVNELIAGLRAENVNTPLGRVTGGFGEAPLRISGKPSLVTGFDAMTIAGRDGRPIPLGQVARVTDGIEERRSMAFVGGVPAIGIDIQKQSGSNTVEVVDAAKRVIERLKPELPPGVEATVVRDASVFIRESVEDVENSMVLGGILTVFIVFCFLNSWRSTVITGLTLPISVISSFIVMHFLGMTLNVMTLMALSLAIGLLIDDAIVVRENIVRHLEHGKDHFTAAREGTAEIGLAVLATTFSIIAVFVPVAFMKGIVGRFFFSFGITVAFAVLVSLFVSFTLDPMLSSRWVDPDIERKGRRNLLSRGLDRFNAWFDRLADVYRGMIAWALDHRKTVSLAAVAAFAGGIMVFGSLESSFMPSYDRGEFQIYFKTAPDASMAESQNRMQAVTREILAIPEVERVYGTIGANDTTVREASVYVKLKEKKERTRTQDEVQIALRKRLDTIPGIVSSIGEAGGFRAEKPINAALRGDNIDLLKKYAAQLKAEVSKIPGLVDLEVTLEHDIPEYRLTVDRDRAVDAGLSSADVSRALGVLVGGQAVSTYEDEDGDAVDVRVRLPETLRGDMGAVSALKLTAPAKTPGQPPALLPISGIARYDMHATPSEINRQDLTRQVVLSASLQNLALGTAVEKVKEAAAKIPMEPGYKLVFSGEAEDMAESFGYMAESLLLAVLFVYLILAAQFESFIDPLSIMLSLPLSLVGMAGMLKITGDTISIMSLIGLIMLMGLVTKNAILLVDYAKILRSQGQSRREALIAAGRTRLRPILMTTLAMIFGMLPLAMAIGAGSEMRAPMARAVIGGLVTSTVLTLLVVPVVYSILDDFAAWLKRKWSGEKSPEESPEGGMPEKKSVVFRLLRAVGVAGLLALLTLAATQAYAQDAAPMTLTLDQALSLAAQRNRDVESAREYQNYLSARVVEERSAALPQIGLAAYLQKSEDKSEAALNGGHTTPTTASGYDVRLQQPLFTWGKVGAAIRAAEVGVLTGADRLRIARQGAALDVITVFSDALYARSLARLATDTLEQKQRHLTEAEKKFAAGVATDYDVLSARVAVENARPAVIRSENLVRIALDRLRFLLALDTPEVDVTGSLETATAPAPDFPQALETALKRRPELEEIRHERDVARELVTIAEAGDKPRLDFGGSYGWHALDPDGPGSGNGPAWNAGITLTVPLFDGLRTKGAVARAQSDASSLRIAEQKLVDAVALSVRDALHRLREAEEIVRALSGTEEQAARLLSMAEKGYEFGVKTKLDVDDAQLNLSASRSDLLRARRDLLVARAALDHAMGTLAE